MAMAKLSTSSARLGIVRALAGVSMLLAALPLLAQQDSSSIHEDSSAALLAAGNTLRDSFNYAGAIASYSRVLDHNPNNNEALLQLSFAYLQTTDFNRSLDVALQGTRLPSDYLPRFNALVALNYHYAIIISEYYENLVARHDSEIVRYRAYNRSQPDGASKIFGLGLTYWSMGRAQIAEECLQQSAGLDSTFSDPLFILGLLQLQRGNYHAAESTFQQFLRVDPESFLAERVRLLIDCIQRKEKR
jgi:tetratricopeptide (TPR) repeat protein